MGPKRKPTRHFSKIQETRVAKELGAKKTANSGATAFDKGDVKDKHFLYECKTKTSETQQITIKKEWLTKNKEEMFSRGKEFNALIFDFGDKADHVILDMRTFQELYKAWKELYSEED